jgi:probable HAF family extracellular repeat protein
VVGACESAFALDHAILWEAGHLTDLGTLGGEMSFAGWINDAGAIIGAADGPFNERLPFLWQDGRMRAIPSLAADALGWEFALETHYVAADGRIWGAGSYRGVQGHIYEMTPQPDGSYSIRSRGKVDGLDPRVYAFNEQGQAAAAAEFHGPTGSRREAIFWDEGGTIRLGNMGKPGSYANALNNRGQVVGLYDSDNYHAFVWENGVMVDLNDLVPPNNGYLLVSADAINDAGLILCNGRNLATGRAAACLLTPLALIKLEITGETWSSEGIRFQVRGAPWLPVAVEWSANALKWASLTTLTNLSDVRDFLDPGARQMGMGLYRARWSTP